jgi:hypothetical protein
LSVSRKLEESRREIARVSEQIEQLKQSVSGSPATDGAAPKPDELQDSLKKIVAWTLEKNNKKQEIERLTKQLISLTGTSVLVAEQDLVLSNFSVP